MQTMTSPRVELRGRSSLRFVAAFAGWLGAFALLFEGGTTLWVRWYMVPLTRLAQGALALFGLPARLVEPVAGDPFCLLQVEQVIYRVTFECTGIFALFLCLASILAFPASWSARRRGVLLVVPAFIVYSTVRLVVLGLVAHWSPAQIDLFHLYVMVVANVGFVLTLWLYWLHHAAQMRLS